MKKIYREKNDLYICNRQDFLKTYNSDKIFNLSMTDDLFYAANPNKEEIKAQVAIRDHYITVNWDDFGATDGYYLKDKSLKKYKAILERVRIELTRRDVIINCTFGISRSSSTGFLFLKYIGYFGDKNFEEAFNLYRKIYPFAAPNPGVYKWIKEVYSKI